MENDIFLAFLPKTSIFDKTDVFKMQFPSF